MDGSQPDLWRYAAALAPLRPDDRVSVGSPVTPLRRPAPGWPWLKYDHLHPTGSYKDRGAAVLVSHLAAARPGATVFDDSSGNAGAALAAASSTAGLRCRVLVPAANDPGKLALIEAFGAEVERIDGDRAAVAAAARDRAGAGLEPAARRPCPGDAPAPDSEIWASHVHDPLYPVGCSTAFLEVWEQMGFRLPGTVVVACGYGSQVTGVLYALEALRLGGARCRVVAVNTAGYPALNDAFATGVTDTTAAGSGPTLAEGIACRNPVRGAEMLAGIRGSGGTVVAVDDHAIVDAVRDLARVGALVEPTGAVAFAGWRHLAATGWLADPEDCCVVLSGSGLKTASVVADLVR